MEPPKIIREADAQEGRGCWMGCFGIGCLVIVIGFFGLLVGGWYTAMHTGLPLVFLEQGLEQDGKIKIEGLTGSISKGIHIDELKFLTVDDEHWSELRGVKFDYNGFIDMSRNGRVIVERMSADSGKIYANIGGPDDFSFSAGELDKIDEFKDSDISELRIDVLEVKQLKIINLDTDYSLEIDEASLKDFVARGKDGIVNFGELTIKSNMLEAVTEASSKWPESSTAKRVRGNLRAKFTERLKQDIDFAFDFDFQTDAQRQSVTLFKDAWVQDFSKQKRSLKLTDFTPADYFVAQQVLPSHIQLVADRSTTKNESEPSDNEADDTEGSKSVWEIAPGASFQLGKTTFQIQAVEGNRAPLRSIFGTATVNGETMTADLRCRDYFHSGRIELKVGDQPADRTDWAQVVYGAEFDSLSRDDQRLVEATIAASQVIEKDPDAKEEDGKEEKPQAEADDSSAPSDDPPDLEKIPQIVPTPAADDQ